MLEAEGIRKNYGKKTVLSGVSLTAEPGQCVGIVGGNGCGKTTLLSILAGARKADGGSLRIDGKEILGSPAVQSAQIAYVPQENPFMEELSVKDNLRLWYKGNKEAMKQDLENGPAAMLGIGGFLKTPVGKLSGGMKKRLSIACHVGNRGLSKNSCRKAFRRNEKAAFHCVCIGGARADFDYGRARGGAGFGAVFGVSGFYRCRKMAGFGWSDSEDSASCLVFEIILRLWG